ncbi:L-Ala-D/L-amino acid epimerase-like protein [Drosera capensis]
MAMNPSPIPKPQTHHPKPTRLHSIPSQSLQPTKPTSHNFTNLNQNFKLKVQSAEARPLNVPLIAPFTIASSRIERVENAAIRVELTDGSVGWGEAPVLPFVTAEDQGIALEMANEVCMVMGSWEELRLGDVLREIGAVLQGHEFASVRAGMEMAIIDAAAQSSCIPLWRLFGGVSNTITTDITIPIVSAESAANLALKYRRQGFATLKLKVGKDLNADIQVLEAIRLVYPDCEFILDANEGYTATEALEVLQILQGSDSVMSQTMDHEIITKCIADVGVTPILFEQPVAKDDFEGLGHVSRVAREKFGVPVAADESCRCISDAKRIAEGNLADVINIKLAKSGVVEALEIIELAIASGLQLMIGGMVETRLAMGFAGHLAAGMGCFRFSPFCIFPHITFLFASLLFEFVVMTMILESAWARYIDLDTPLLLSEDPVSGGYEVFDAVYKFRNSRGHGGSLCWDNPK